MAPPRDEQESLHHFAAATDPVQLLAESGVTEVPKLFIQPAEHSPAKEDVNRDGEIPVIDMKGFDGDHKEYALSQLARACEEWGFFQVINHGIDEDLLQSVRKVTREFFKLPPEVKQRWAMKPGTYHGYGRFNTSDAEVADWVDVLAQVLLPEALRDDDHRPTEPEEYRDVIEAYGQEFKRFVLGLSAAISESLGLKPDYIQRINGEFTATLRSNYYPPCPQPDHVLGVASHSDGGILTVLIEEGGSGLQVRKDGQWVAVNTLPNAVIVNVGDMLQVMSNGRYKSVDHRAVVSQTTERYSMVTFYFPSEAPGVTIEPAKELVSEANPARYRATNFQAYLMYFVTTKLRGKARLDSLLIEP